MVCIQRSFDAKLTRKQFLEDSLHSFLLNHINNFFKNRLTEFLSLHENTLSVLLNVAFLALVFLWVVNQSGPSLPALLRRVQTLWVHSIFN